MRFMQHDLLKRKRSSLTSTLCKFIPSLPLLVRSFFSQTCLLISQNVRAFLTVLIYSYFPAVIRCCIYTFPDSGLSDSGLAFWMSADTFQTDKLEDPEIQPRTQNLKHEFRIIWDCMCVCMDFYGTRSPQPID